MQNYTYIETYGCSANKNNSEILKGLLTQAGYPITNNENIADIIVINSCIVKGKTENKIKRRIQDLSGSKKLVIVCGCMPETDAKEIVDLNPNVLLLGVKHFKEIVKLIRDYREGKLKQKKYLDSQNENKIGLPKISDNKLISITQIGEGCLGDCSYCKTKLAKGKLVSYDVEDIVKSVENDLKSGAKEVWITSQDCAVYGMDKGSSRLVELLNEILKLKHRFKLRLGMCNPNNLFLILDELVDIYKNPKMYKFLHVPIQSADDSVLKDMKRRYKIDVVEKIINKFREEFPEMVIATDIIVGYPTESVKAHEYNLEFINKFKPDVFNLSKFSRHKGTGAWKLKELPIKIVNKRASELMTCHRDSALENKKKFLDKEIKVFVNKKLGEGLFEGRDENYNIVLVKGEDLLGKNVDVVIRNVGVHHLIGEME